MFLLTVLTNNTDINNVNPGLSICYRIQDTFKNSCSVVVTSKKLFSVTHTHTRARALARTHTHRYMYLKNRNSTRVSLTGTVVQ